VSHMRQSQTLLHGQVAACKALAKPKATLSPLSCWTLHALQASGYEMFLLDQTNSYRDTEREGELRGSKPSVVRGSKSEVNIISEYYVIINS